MKFSVQPGFGKHAAFCVVSAGEWYSGPPSEEAVPVGSVEWTLAYARTLGVGFYPLPTYPIALSKFWRREVRPGVFSDALPSEFVKPVRCKSFDGGIRSSIRERVSPSERVWISEPVSFLAEWRCYVCEGEIVGVAQYGEGEDRELDLSAAREMIDAEKGSAGWALDVGLLESGETALVEANDGWALGYYAGCSAQAYLRVISSRWREIVEQHKLEVRSEEL